MTDRAAFEQHFQLCIRQREQHRDGSYRDPITQARWEGYQARPVATQVEPMTFDGFFDGLEKRGITHLYVPELDKTAQGERQPCFHLNTVVQLTGDGTPVEFCRDCGINRA